MYLKRLELQGFKSFADKTILEFRPGITTVIGPNGSGKSNISDAIRWVLGEQSMKSLRGAKSEDIIFAGTQNRKSLGFAEVSIVIDNSDNKLPVEFAEVTVTRRIYRSGETGYFINRASCRLKDILELFMDTGIGKDGYSIIGQGKIDEILSNKSEERRHIFEEAAGIVKYRTRKLESEKKLEQTKLNLLRINDILSEIEEKIEPLRNQSEKAKRFLTLREELKEIEIGLFLHNIDEYKKKIAEILENTNILESQNEAENENLSKMQTLKEKLKIEIDNITDEIEDMQNLGFESTNKIEKLNSEINVSNERIANNKENFERYFTEIEEINLKIQELEEEKTNKLEKKNNLYENKEKYEKELEEKEKQLKELTSSLSKKEIEIEGKKQELQDNIDEKYNKSTLVNTQNINFENLEKREKTIKEEISNNISELDNSRIIKEEIAKTFYEIENKRKTISDSLDEIEAKRNESEGRLNKYEEEINRLASESRIKDCRRKFLIETEREKEGYNKSVKSLLLACEKDSNLNNGVHGVLANILSVPKEYEIAIEMSLGFALQNIVTETELEAKRLVEFLRKNNLGRASFLPISSMKGKKIEKIDSKDVKGMMGIASDLIKYDKKYEQIVLNLLGRTVIVEDMDSAIALSKKNKNAFKIVTLKGDIINPSGAITGGSVATKTVNILGRKKEIEELEKQLKNIDVKIQNLEKERKDYKESIEDILEQVVALEKELQDIDIVYATEKQRLVSIEENVKKLETKLELLRKEKNELENEKVKNREERDKLQGEIEQIEKQNVELENEISEFAEQNKDNQKYIDDLNFDITNLKISVTSFNESESSIDEIVERVNLDIENNTKRLENKKELREKIILENENLEKYIENLKEQIEKIETDVGSNSKKIEEFKQKRIDKNKKLDETEKNISSQFNVIDGIKDQIAKIDVKKSKFEFELEQIINKMWEEYEVTPNNVEEYEKPQNVIEVQRQVNKLRQEIKSLGSINIDSIEEYKQTKERYDFMCEQRLDLENSSAKLRKVISEMTVTMKEQFETQFKIINKNFGEIFKELFGGGNADVKLTDESNILECGIEIEVQPPGKKLQNMMLLSGGEKALTAIALLFAILKINPAPFCVLDEIEAALDDVNVYRFADYLRKFSKDVQFLVITHRKGTMEVADTVYGVTMEENGISKLLSIKLK